MDIWNILRWLNVALAFVALSGLITETRCYWIKTYCPKERTNLVIMYIAVLGLLVYNTFEVIDSHSERMLTLLSLVLIVLVTVRNNLDYPKWYLVYVRSKKNGSTRIAP